MWIIILGYGVTTALLAWLLFGYVVWLRFAGDLRARSNSERPTSWKRLSIVVPCLNEADGIEDKYKNLVGGEYPRDQLEIVFADGGSDDGTREVLAAIAAVDDRIRVVVCPIGGKINQINYVLPMLSGEIVVVSDADARLRPDALAQLVGEFARNPAVAVVGAFTHPRGGIAVDRCYWAAQNRVRLMESAVRHVSMVVACCYAFKRELLSAFPDDVVADDVYIAALANTLGHESAYSGRAIVEELRAPSTLPEFFAHKFRKSNAVLREMLRFSYRVADMNGRWRSILATRVVQQLALPWATVLWFALAATLANFGQIDVPLIGAGVLFVALLATRKATMSITLPVQAERYSAITVALAFLYTNAILFVTVLTFLSFRQSSRYRRLASGVRTADRAAVTPPAALWHGVPSDAVPDYAAAQHSSA